MTTHTRRNHRTLSRVLLAGATLTAALGVLSVRLSLGVLAGERNAICAGAGAVGGEWHEPGHPPGHAWRWGPLLLDRVDDPIEWLPMIERGQDGDGLVALPLWIPVAAMLIPGAWLAIAHRRRSGCCPHCQYDLTGLEPGAPCPECGRPSPLTRDGDAQRRVPSTGDHA
ncbi:MAG TPA: hypothetical protein VHC70_00870 [Phycisphaerales bacterium]|nr:hypothetical protein [Phycisphaerales bacterium]